MSLVAWGTNLILDWISTLGYPGIVFLMALESACMPVPSEIVMPFAGYLVYRDSEMTLLGITLAGSLGCALGSIAAYAVGFYAGRPFVIRYGKYILLRERHLHTAEKWFEKYGDAATFIARLLPVVRTVISLPAGIAKMNFKRFVFYSFVGSFPWTLMLGHVGYWLGPNWEDVVAVFRGLDVVVILAGIGIIVWYVIRLRKNNAKEAKAQP
ncbi:MAG: DedA family protein [Thermoplasmata archaeon]